MTTIQIGRKLQLIHGDCFRDAADIDFSEKENSPLNKDELVIRIGAQKNKLLVIYAHTHHCNTLFKILSDMSPTCPIILVSHNSDGRVRRDQFRDGDADLGLAPACIKKWFAQNVDCEDSRLEPLPIGLERPRVDPAARKCGLVRKLMLAPRPLQKIKLYLNHTVSTNPEVRSQAYKLFENSNYAVSEHGGLTYAGFLKKLRTCIFCLSPPGNGPDCHRTWECLYLGTAPVVLNTPSNRALYSDLRVLMVNDYKEVSENLLDQFQLEATKKNLALEKLDCRYYFKKIGDAVRVYEPSRKLRVERFFYSFKKQFLF